MPKWEYCTVGPIKTTNDGSLAPSLANRTYITSEGKKAKVIKDINDDLFLTLAQLGNDGWEMVGCGSVKPDTHVIYFKRLIE